MHWIHLTDEDQLKQLITKSEERPQVIFKHSIRCNISSVALNRIEKDCCPGNTDFYYLDLISYRSISNKIAELFHVPHESPQVLVIKKGECVYEESHLAITMDDIREEVAA